MQLAAIIVLLIVLSVAFLSGSIYNFIHGIVTLVAIGILLVFISFLLTKAEVNTDQLDQALKYIYLCVAIPYADIMAYFKLGALADTNRFIFYLPPIGVWIVSLLISSLIRKIMRRDR